MPEGDTIYRAARALQRSIGGHVVTGFETGLAKLARVNDDAPLAGRTVEKVEAKGKWCLLYFSPAPGGDARGEVAGELILVTHMLMSGSWHLYRTGERWRMGRDRMRVVIKTAEWQAVAFNVPVAEFHTPRSLERYSMIPKLGVDVLAESYTPQSGADRLAAYAKAHPDAEIAVVLLKQTVLAGLGNVYKSEVAFAAGVNPFRSMRTITPREMDVMADVAQKYMKANVLDGSGDGIVTYFGNRRTTGNSNRDERLWVYGRQGQECRRCGATVMMRKQGEQARSTYWCPECQPWVGMSGDTPVGKTMVVRRRKVGC
jgi:endonuclease-8